MAILISTPQDLNNVRNNLSGSYELVNDIDMSNWGNFKPIGESTSTKQFNGQFNGNGFKIKNLTINENHTNVGLFGYIENATIQNLGIENAIVTSNSYNYVGILVGYQYINSNVFNCYSTGQVSGQYGVGGLVGWNYGGKIENSFSHVKATGLGRVGGLLGNGANPNAIVKNCYSTGLVTVTPDPTIYNGGLIGSHADMTVVTNSYYDINTSGQTISAGGIGKTTAEMKTQSTYEEWDFNSIWGINGDYPYLQIFGVPTAPPKVETITVSSFVYDIGSNTRKHISTTKQLNTTLTSIQTATERHTATLRSIESYLSQIETTAQMNARTVRTGNRDVQSFILPIGSSVYRESKTVKRLLANIKPLSSDTVVLYPLNTITPNGYVFTLENNSRVFKMDNMSTVSYIINPSKVEVRV